MKKGRFLALVITLSIFFTVSLNNIFASSMYGTLENGESVFVEKVIEGNAFLVSKDGQEFLVKLIGIDTEGYDATIEILESFILSKEVTFNVSPNGYDLDDRWNYGTLRYLNTDIGSFILESGLGKVDLQSIDNTHLEHNYVNDQQFAQDRGYYIWEDELDDVYFVVDAININTASISQLQDDLDISNTLAKAIYYYKEENPINNHLELKFVDGVTVDIYEDIKNKFVVATNINTASFTQLVNLPGISEYDAKKIEQERINSHLNSSKLKNLGVLSESQFDDIIDFIYFDGVKNTIDSVYPRNKVVNINTASDTQINETGIRKSHAQSIVSQKNKHNFVYKNFLDLQKLSNLGNTFNKNNNYKYYDNLNFVTNINTASVNEIESLYGDLHSDFNLEISTLVKNRPYENYSEISQYFPSELHSLIENVVVFKDEDTNYININTATKSQLVSFGITENEARDIINHRPIKTYTALDDDIEEFASEITLFTNINIASYDELKYLDTHFDDSVIREVISYREKQPFGSLDEVEDLFEEIDETDLFEDIEDFITIK